MSAAGAAGPGGVMAAIRRVAQRFDARAPRERMVLLLCAAAVALWACDRLAIGPAFEHARQAQARVEAARQALAQLQTQHAQQREQAAALERQLRAELADWRRRVQDGAQGLRRQDGTLVAPDRMVDLLERMVPRDGRLKVRELRSLPPGELAALAPAAAASGAGGSSLEPGLYRHGVELTLQGPYADLVAYLQALEAMPQRVLWGGLQLKVEQHPQVVLTLKLYTLSLDRGWLEL